MPLTHRIGHNGFVVSAMAALALGAVSGANAAVIYDNGVSAEADDVSRVPVAGGLTAHRTPVNTAAVKTTFDLPDLLLRRAKAVAAEQGRPLRDLIAEAITDKLAAPPRAAPTRRTEPPTAEWKAYLATLERQPDGSYVNPNGIDDESYFEDLDDIRVKRLQNQARLFPAPKRPAGKPGGRD